MESFFEKTENDFLKVKKNRETIPGIDDDVIFFRSKYVILWVGKK